MQQIFSESRSKIHIMSEDKKKIYTFDVPGTTSLGEAYDAITTLKDKLWEKMEENKKTEDDKKKEKEPVPNVQKETELPKKEECKAECKAALQEKTPAEKKKELEEKIGLTETLLGKDKK